jgi:hypothetical protein
MLRQGQASNFGVYMGRRNLRGVERVYVHIPVSLAALNGLDKSRRVVVTATLNSGGCGQLGARLDGSTFRFTSSLAPAGGSYRVVFPQDYSRALVELAGCASVDLWLQPIIEPRLSEGERYLRIAQSLGFEIARGGERGGQE